MSIRNDSQKIITAFTWVVEGTYADGSVQSHRGTVDRISDLQFNRATFRAGVSRPFQDTLPFGAENDRPLSAVAHLTMVVFHDDTAVGERRSIARLAAVRKSMAELEAEELDQIQKALQAPVPEDAIREVIAEHEAKGQWDATIRQILAQLENNASPEVIEALQSALRAYQALLAEHTTLTAVVQ